MAGRVKPLHADTTRLLVPVPIAPSSANSRTNEGANQCSANHRSSAKARRAGRQ